MKHIELLAPAKNHDIGIEAINHGADAVYIGASNFGARKAACNSTQDIEKLILHAHKYNSRVYVALNTLLYENELKEAEKLIYDLYNIGADALIIQDMGILEMDIPEIQLFASTQTNNYTPEKIKFLEDAGFSRVILARELSFEQISEISSQTQIDLEFFVHGALCVSLSGQCYLSQHKSGRSANRGECAQPCRLSYDLVDSKGTVLEKNKHLLSLKDLNLSSRLKNLIDAGISSFKIEGRLKNESYVKNITSYYRGLLDSIIEGRSDLKKTSTGKSSHLFTPDPFKSFNRGVTEYFTSGRTKGMNSPDTPKSIGEKVGKVKSISGRYFELEKNIQLTNGDGLCYFDANKKLCGLRVNKTENERIFPHDPKILSKKGGGGLTSGAIVFRNHDQGFEKLLEKNSSVRKIDAAIIFEEDSNGFIISAVDEDGTGVSINKAAEKTPADNPESAEKTIITQLSKAGDTIFNITGVKVNLTQSLFIKKSELNSYRRDILDKLETERIESYNNQIKRKPGGINTVYPEPELSFKANITNTLSESFYKKHGVTKTDNGFELSENVQSADLMTTRYCINYELGLCRKKELSDKHYKGMDIKPPFFLVCGKDRYKLVFDCNRCMMTLREDK